MSYNTIIQQGTFTQGATATDRLIAIRSDVDWMRVINWTTVATPATEGVEYFWQRGMAVGTGMIYSSTAGTGAIKLTALANPNGFILLDTSNQALSALDYDGTATITAVSNAAIPVVSNAGAANGLVAGDVVRLFNIAGAHQIDGYDFTVGRNTLTANTFDLSFMAQLAVAGTTGHWRKVNYDPIYYPRRRYITAITQAAQAVVTMSVTHGFTVGQKVRFYVDPAFGMVQMNGLQGTITAVSNPATLTLNTITVDIDSSGFTAFAFPAAAAAGTFTPAQVVPIGEDTSTALIQIPPLDILADSTINTAYIGMKLPAGANSPGGAANDVVYWIAGKSFSV